MKAIYKTNIAPDVKEEWMQKEYGSWEDHNEPKERHIYPLLESMPNDKIVCNTMEEVKLVHRSASYQIHWDGDNDSLERRLKAKCKNITNQLAQLL